MADTTLYLEFFSIISVAWQWLIQGITAHKALNNGASGGDISFYKVKSIQCSVFIDTNCQKSTAWQRF
ncbi:MAG: acyl-CoA dehydrogenase C-terminal domain-containing protein [Thermodesulfobacteriota bacterium]|nr:acyl-CoA dehydrogenase C-terminal domain-containing protein [Thermodesulfobacteriota bacterium]